MARISRTVAEAVRLYVDPLAKMFRQTRPFSPMPPQSQGVLILSFVLMISIWIVNPEMAEIHRLAKAEAQVAQDLEHMRWRLVVAEQATNRLARVEADYAQELHRARSLLAANEIQAREATNRLASLASAEAQHAQELQRMRSLLAANEIQARETTNRLASLASAEAQHAQELQRMRSLLAANEIQAREATNRLASLASAEAQHAQELQRMRSLLAASEIQAREATNRLATAEAQHLQELQQMRLLLALNEPPLRSSHPGGVSAADSKADALHGIGLLLQADSIISASGDAKWCLTNAVEAHRRALEIYSRGGQDWAKTQNDLGVALRTLAARSSPEEAEKLLRGAVAAHRAALGAYTQGGFPRECAITQRELQRAGSELQEVTNKHRVSDPAPPH